MTEPTIAELRKPKILAVVVGALLLILAGNTPHRPSLIWNASDSVAVGLYRLSDTTPLRGDLVALRLPPSIADLASQRGYLPRSALLLKPIAAVAGDRVCRHHSLVFANGALRAVALRDDDAGRPLPLWRNCHTLRGDEIFVLSRHTGSFDSRYFGVIPMRDIVGRAIPVWPMQH
jgi:conjugative transfer signal peptidase TraF